MFMAQCYAPEDVSAAVLITELAVDLARRGYKITMVTCAPNYPHGKVYPGYRNRLYQVEWLDGVRVVRTWNYISPRKTFWRRLFNYGCYSATAFYGGLLGGKPDILVNYSPPLPLGLTACFLSRLWRVPWVLQLEDLYPEAAVAAGVLHNRTVISFFSAMESFLYRSATHISVISQGFRRNLLGKGVPSEKITLIPVWADPDLVRPLPRNNTFRNHHGLARKFIVMYAGNMGHTASLEDVLDAAALLKKTPDICFLLIGEGIKKLALERMANSGGLENVRFLPYQPREYFSEMLASADVSLVTLNRSSSLTSLPSKIFNIMASARPVIAICPPESELAILVKESECGVTLPCEHPERLAEVIMRLRQEKEILTTMGRNGRCELEARFAREHCVKRYEQMLLDLCHADLRSDEHYVATDHSARQ
jgi:colanic acid biosynthesis glycosyl transferase WcaI